MISIPCRCAEPPARPGARCGVSVALGFCGRLGRPPLDSEAPSKESAQWHTASHSSPATAPGRRSPRPPARPRRDRCGVRLGRPGGRGRHHGRRRAPAAGRRDRVDQGEQGRDQGPDHDARGHARSVNVALRKALDLYACVRPCKSYEGVRSKYDGIDLVFVRENTEDLYAGIEFEKDTTEELALAGKIELAPGVHIRDHSGISIKPISVEGTTRVVRFAFDLAENDRSKVTAVHKANIMKHTDGLWLASRPRSRRTTPASSSRSGSSTTCACSSCRSPSCTT